MTISIVFDALTKDAELWDGVGDGLVEIHGVIESLAIPASAFMQKGAPASAAYDELCGILKQLLTDGETQTRGAAKALREIRTEFETLDANIIQDLEGLWEPAI